MQTYIAPLQGAISPAFWCFSGSRTFGPIVVTLGSAISGTRGEPAELLQILDAVGPSDKTSVPKFTHPRAAVLAVAWWTEAINNVLGVLTDPTSFSTERGEFDVAKQVQWLASIEQLFERVASIQAVHRNRDAREVLFFSALDSLERITGHDFDLLCTYSFAESRMEAIRTSMPEAAAEILLVNAGRALTALQEVQTGFFMSPGDGDIELRLPGEKTQSLRREIAVAKYLKLRRNSTHGHGSNRLSNQGLVNALLSQHNGHLGHDLGFLAYLHLLWMISNPEILASRISGARP